jgi:hypothetical protein
MYTHAQERALHGEHHDKLMLFYTTFLHHTLIPALTRAGLCVTYNEADRGRVEVSDFVPGKLVTRPLGTIEVGNPSIRITGMDSGKARKILSRYQL